MPDRLAPIIAKSIAKSLTYFGGFHTQSKTALLAAFKLAKAFRPRSDRERADFKYKGAVQPDTINNLGPLLIDLRGHLNGPQAEKIIDVILRPLINEDGYQDFKLVAERYGIRNLP